MPSYSFKRTILTYLQKQTAGRTPIFYAVAFGGLFLSGAVTAVANMAPPEKSSFSPSVFNIQEDVALPAYEYVDNQEAPFIHEATMRPGETVLALLARMGIKDADLAIFIAKNNAARPLLTQLKPNTTIVATTSRQGLLLSLSVIKSDKLVTLSRSQGELKVQEQALVLEHRKITASGTIRSSLFGATDEIGLPDSTANALVSMFSNNIDFHRDLRQGDAFTVVYEMLYYRGTPVKTGRILGAAFTNKGKQYTTMWYETSPGKGEYYAADGRSLREGFLRSPLPFSRISSGFSMRFHPILKKWKEHTGTDFAAPTGTPAKATANGVVAFVGVQRGYGNVIILRHKNGFSSVYGHLSAFAHGLTKGQSVSQGDVIGFVGSTGYATGPHLHYELRINNIPQNPMTVQLPSADPLSPSQLADFHAKTASVLNRIVLASSYANKVKFAQR